MDKLTLWGKTVQGNDRAYHPALYHMIDAGMVARTLLSPPCSVRWRVALGRALSTDGTKLAHWLPWLVALHDLGKCSASFQAMVPAQKGRLRAAGWSFGRAVMGLGQPHPVLSQIIIGADPAIHDLPDALRTVWAQAVGAHHGVWVSPAQSQSVRRRMRREPPAWQAARQESTQLLRELFVKEPAAWPVPADLSTGIMMLTGFMVLCDWLASDQDRFPAAWDVPYPDYVVMSEKQAREAVAEARLDTPVSSDAPTEFHALFADYAGARHLQAAADDVPDALLREPALIIIEAPTGEGKTEAALALAHRLGRHAATDEFYYALPTMATSNQMYRRVREHMERRLALDMGAHLIHGQAYLLTDDLQVRPHEENDSPGEREAVLRWFAPKKRALLAPFGVGTIDQAELAALNVRHGMLRMIGLAGKVLILDEVHAYDMYMTTIIERLLRWLRGSGTSVILLSATLPMRQREALARAWGVETSDHPLTEAYPLLWVASGQGLYRTSPPAEQADRHLRLGWLGYSENQAPAKAQWLLDAVAEGGCACWIVNTVGRAQDIYRALREQALPDIELHLLHARYPLAWREERERRIVKRFGKKGPRPRKAIVVGTQVLEQSLDLDFDLMVSDLAPVDLLLQRAGRLHRHERAGRPIDEARLYINVATEPDGALVLDTDAHVYAEYMLRQTERLLRLRDELVLPRDYRALVEAVYSDQPELPEDLIESWETLQQQEYQHRKEAELRLLPEPDSEEPFCHVAARSRFEEDEDSANWSVAQTRLGDESVTVIPLERDGGRCRVPGATEWIRLHAAPCRAQELDLMRHSLRLSHQGLVAALKRDEQRDVPLFRESSLLAFVYPLWLREGRAEIVTRYGSVHVELDDDLGLVISRKEE